MIRLSHINIETPIVLNPASPITLSVESPKEYYDIVGNLSAAFNGESSEFSFWEESSSVSPDKYGEIILSPFYFNATDKKIINLLYKKLQSNYNDSTFLIEFNEINAKIENFLYNLCSTVNFSLDHNCLSIEDMLKASSVKPAKTYDTLLEKLVCYINIFTELKSALFFVLVGFKEVLSNEELAQLFRHCELQKVSLLLIEGSSGKKALQNERRIIITEDLCEIVENIEEMY